jgi:hypothetical protein
VRPTCKIQWIDCKGDPTPDERVAIGEVYTQDEPGRRWPICAEHAKFLDKFVVHHDPHCHHRPRGPMAKWVLERY